MSYLSSEQDLLRNFKVLIVLATTSTFNLILIESYLKADHALTFSITDLLAAIVFGITLRNRPLKGVMIGSFMLVLLSSMIVVITIWIKGKDLGRFKEEAGFTNQIGELGYPEQEPLEALEINIICLLHLTRFAASLTLMLALYFCLHHMTSGSARRTATIVGVAYSVAWAFVILVQTVASLLTI